MIKIKVAYYSSTTKNATATMAPWYEEKKYNRAQIENNLSNVRLKYNIANIPIFSFSTKTEIKTATETNGNWSSSIYYMNVQIV